MTGGGGRSKSALGHSAGASSVTKLPPIGRRHGSAGLANDARSQCVVCQCERARGADAAGVRFGTRACAHGGGRERGGRGVGPDGVAGRRQGWHVRGCGLMQAAARGCRRCHQAHQEGVERPH